MHYFSILLKIIITIMKIFVENYAYELHNMKCLLKINYIARLEHRRSKSCRGIHYFSWILLDSSFSWDMKIGWKLKWLLFQDLKYLMLCPVLNATEWSSSAGMAVRSVTGGHWTRVYRFVLVFMEFPDTDVVGARKLTLLCHTYMLR